jgi:hypothetical protein
MAQAKSTAPVKVAVAMEGMKFKSFNGEVEMRKTDHQLQQTLFISSWKKAGAKPNDYSVENTGYNFQPVKTLRALRLEHTHFVPDEAARAPVHARMPQPAGSIRPVGRPAHGSARGAGCFVLAISSAPALRSQRPVDRPTWTSSSSTCSTASAPACCCSCSAQA